MLSFGEVSTAKIRARRVWSRTGNDRFLLMTDSGVYSAKEMTIMCKIANEETKALRWSKVKKCRLSKEIQEVKRVSVRANNRASKSE